MKRKAQEGDLGPNQIKWLRENVKQFDHSWKSAESAARDMEANRIAMAKATKGASNAAR